MVWTGACKYAPTKSNYHSETFSLAALASRSRTVLFIAVADHISSVVNFFCMSLLTQHLASALSHEPSDWSFILNMKVVGIICSLFLGLSRPNVDFSTKFLISLCMLLHHNL